MPKRKPTDPALWQFSDHVRKWVADRYPTADFQENADRMIDWHLEKDERWKTNYDAALRNWMRRGYNMAHKAGFESPAWTPLIKEAKELGFDPPLKTDTPDLYRTKLRQFEPPVKSDIGNVIGGLFGSKRK